MSRPEHVAPPDIFYDDVEAKKYAANSRMIEIQSQMSARAIELLNLPDRPCYLLDIGCGSGLSGEVLSEKGHIWVGLDISKAMLGVALQREVEGDLFNADIGQGLFFRPGAFDGCISISALQWLCNADRKEHVPQKRLKKFFQSLYQCLSRGARAVLQFYPETPQQMTLITTAAMRSGFSGGLVVDYPNSTKAKKYFLCLFAGVPDAKKMLPKGLGEEDEVDMTEDKRQTILFSAANKEAKGKRAATTKDNKHKSVKSRDWIQAKKERMRKQGRTVAHDSKFTGRKRKPTF